jgi:hypothetical protein
MCTYGIIQLGEAAFFKVSFLSLGNDLVLGDQFGEGGLDHVLDFILGVGLGTLARLNESLLNGAGQGRDLSIDLGIGVGSLLT